MARSILAGVKTTTDIIRRHIACPVCGARFSIQRRGIPGGALAATARLRGQLFEHLNVKHPGWNRDGGAV